MGEGGTDVGVTGPRLAGFYIAITIKLWPSTITLDVAVHSLRIGNVLQVACWDGS